MNEKVQQIEGEIKLSEEKVDQLNSNNQEYQDQIEKTKNQLELINNQLQKQNEDIINFEENTNFTT